MNNDNNDPAVPSFLSMAVTGILRDVMTALAGTLAADGFVSHDQEAGLVGSGCFIGMIVFNLLVRKFQHKKIVAAGE
jgi:acyl dehydratase